MYSFENMSTWHVQDFTPSWTLLCDINGGYKRTYKEQYTPFSILRWLHQFSKEEWTEYMDPLFNINKFVA